MRAVSNRVRSSVPRRSKCKACRYPVEFSVEYPDRKLNRLTTFFRIFTVIPIAIVASLLVEGGSGEYPT